MSTKIYASQDWVAENTVLLPAVVTVGQSLIVKSVDENGKPIEWEAVDPWVIASSTEGSTKKFKISIDDTGTLIVSEIVVEEVE